VALGGLTGGDQQDPNLTPVWLEAVQLSAEFRIEDHRPRIEVNCRAAVVRSSTAPCTSITGNH
jgi:hypothetical protein